MGVIDDRIQEKEGWLKYLASERVKDPTIFDDALQEARLALYTILSRWPDAPNEYLNAALKKSLVNSVTRQHWTGMSSITGRPIDPMRRARESIDRMVEDGEDLHYTQDLDGHLNEQEVITAVRELPERQRKVTYLKFWQGMEGRGIGQELGVSKSVANEIWRTKAAPALRARLAHLQEEAA